MDPISRRDLLVGGVVYGSSLWMLLQVPRPLAARAAATSSRPLVLTEAAGGAREAITARIIPTDDQPGAVEAGCTNFIDKALAHEDAALKPVYKAGLARVDARAPKRLGKPFVTLAAEQQDEVLLAVEAGKAGGWPKGD